MKILHVVQCYYPAIGGSEALIKNYSEQLVTRHQDEVTVFTAAAQNAETFWRTKGPLLPPGTEQINGVTVRRFKVFNGLQKMRMLAAHGFRRLNLPYHDWARTIQTGPIIFDLAKAISESGADVVLATAFPFLHMYYAVAGAKRAGIPIALLGSIHVADKWGYDRQMMYQAIEQADAYVALTSFEREHLIQKGIPAEKIFVIGGGVTMTSFQAADGQPIRRRYHLGDKPVAIFMGRQSQLKRLDILIRAMPIVWAKDPNLQLLIAGAKTSYSPQLDQMIKVLPEEQQSKITVIDNFSDEDKANLLAASDLLVHPSGNESFGLIFVEAWAAKKPVIGANVGCVPSLIDEGQDGLLFNYDDPESLAQTMLRLLEKPERSQQMGQTGYEKVCENYTWEVVTDRLRSVYNSMMSNPR